MESRGRPSADQARGEVRTPRVELHSIQRPIAAHRQILPPSLGQQASTQPQNGMQVYRGGSEGGDRVAGPLRQPMGQDRHPFDRQN
ncbi:unnamed protein product [Linum tenue]|uniref:Uncharacterized protein n=1 Tax=Linum tenue TaxID=586396 RepID=A0AAV0H9N8_9ROSI|nr:unnamed protein product [Linum tenue]